MILWYTCKYSIYTLHILLLALHSALVYTVGGISIVFLAGTIYSFPKHELSATCFCFKSQWVAKFGDFF